MSASSSSFTVPFFIGGKDTSADKSFDVVSPSDGKVAHRCGSATLADASAAIAAAADAFKTWRRTTPVQRRDIFLKAADIMAARREELAGYMATETGATPPWCNFNLDVGIGMLKDIAGRIATLEGSFPALMDPNTSAIVMREPYGVVLAMAPWNAPFILGTRCVAFPIAAGNTVVFKGSEVAPRTMSAIVSVFREAGLPDGVLNFIVHEPSAAAEITAHAIAHPQVKKINFTGSTQVGRIIGRLAGENLKPLVLELGGKAPAIVWEDADLQLAADQCALGSFLHSGQICMSTEKILVHESVKKDFLDKLVAAVEKIFPTGGDALTLINSTAVDKNKALVKDATSKGASVVFGNPDAQEASGTRLRPIVVDNVTTDMELYRTESFGPTVSVIGIESEDEAIRIANDTEYGLTSAVFTEDLRRGLRFAREIETGAVHINNMTVHDETALPHGGAKASGYGRFNASKGLDEWVRTKNVTFKH
ncbi:vanillin dehydrogenase [Purpureocillium lilacinum]|uniref:Vanillin dehydrogenase n=1 Tax=Purpureocillium lilacinum TaxID=33203 RepID=A0A179GPW4_PURLI|nr:vanillin dehydrogenase [Purpureocillium lilacinum]OAQ79341.1 vanillin dehydrogenase [Purpureocillium lilacinum]